MTVVLTKRADINLETVFRVAWQGEDVQIAPDALERIGECRRAFMALIDNDPDIVIYGVTTGAGDGASVRLSPEERKARSTSAPVTRGILGMAEPNQAARGRREYS